MPSYAFYLSEYMGDVVDEESFSRLAARADEQLRRYERIYTVTEPEEGARDMATCAMVDALSAIETMLSGDGGAVSSASIGSVSVSYGSPTSLGVDLSEKGQERQLYKAVSRYLDIYRGVPC